MAEYKQYITQIQENGNVMISEDVVSTIVEHALTEVEGFAALSPKPTAELISKNRGRGLKIQISEDNSLTIGCYIVVKYGCSVVSVASAVQSAVTNAVESVTGVKVTAVNVSICGIARQ